MVTAPPNGRRVPTWRPEYTAAPACADGPDGSPNLAPPTWRPGGERGGARGRRGSPGCADRGPLPARAHGGVVPLRGVKKWRQGRPAIYALPRICHMEYKQGVRSAFAIIAEPNRRAILRLLASSAQSVGEIEHRLRMPQPTVSKHLRVLREAGFVKATVDAQRRVYRLNAAPLQEVDVWLARFRRFWSAHVDALERHLDRLDQAAPAPRPRSTKRTKTRTRRGR